MTRDEAVQGLVSNMAADGNDLSLVCTLCAKWIDAFVALGMLKLDEPKSVRERAVDALVSIRIGRTSAPAIIDVLSDAGLKIVDK